MSYYEHQEPKYFRNPIDKSITVLVNECPLCHEKLKWFPYRKDWECQNPKCPIEIIRVKSLF